MQPDFYLPIPTFADWIGNHNHIYPFYTGSRDDYFEFDNMRGRLRELVDEGDSETVANVLRRIAREAAAETGAVEGLYELRPGYTRTIASEEPGWESLLSKQGADTLNQFGDQLNAYEFVSVEARQTSEVTEYWVRGLHTRVCARQSSYKVLVPIQDGFREEERELKSGTYKTQNNDVVRRDGTKHHFAPVGDVQPEMARLVDEVRSQKFTEAHPVFQASYVQYCLTHIHPFPDGNGRTARAWASLYTYRAYGLPVVVYADRRNKYLQALESANVGKYSEVVQYFLYRAIDDMSRGIQELEVAAMPLDAQLESLLSIKPSDSLVTLADASELARRVINHIMEVSSGVAARLQGNSTDVFSIEVVEFPSPSMASTGSMPSGVPYRAVRAFLVRAVLVKPAPIKTDVHIAIGVANDLAALFSFYVSAVCYSTGSNSENLGTLKLTYEDAFPDLGTGTIERLSLYVDKVIGGLLSNVRASLRKTLRQGGLSAD